MIDVVVQGVLLGGYYAILAAGLAFLYSVMGLFNLAHGSFAVLAAYFVVMLCDALGLDPFLAIALVVLALGVIGVVVERLVFEPSTRGGPLLSVLATFGLSVVLDNAMFQVFGANTRSLAPYIGDLSWASWELGDLYVGKLAVITLVAAVAVLGGLHLFLTHTGLGRAIRATAQDADTAGLVGIDPRRARTIAAAIAFMTIGLAGAALGMRATFTPYSGTPQLLFAFQAAVIGGSNSIWGTLIGGIVLGLSQTIGAEISTQGFFIAGNLVFFAVLFARLYGGSLRLPALILKRKV
ncbi:branched-chain amino acid ABC transporter permease [Sinisalibacter aestuarii]|uniref:Branched-chain amino acid ABC transporter permease n=1 Tax=Sinisalibacter aestuarii TaxID=2949426 RepID=A0ABQ5LYS6_9RHOB|nr:branched-chain amino acid ABC transporter permease [Sinisalibacter aestuarii]GKY90124.1 branched-chain amino acid ABC transporter permease [Sinisalibacter aestuarii]